MLYLFTSLRVVQVIQDIHEIPENVFDLIAKNRVQRAIDLLILWFKHSTDRKTPLYEVIVISSNFRQIDRLLDQGLIPYADYQLYRTRLLHQICKLIEEVSQYTTDSFLKNSS